MQYYLYYTSTSLQRTCADLRSSTALVDLRNHERMRLAQCLCMYVIDAE